MQPVKEDSFKQEVLESELPVVVDFWAPWCGPCRQYTPIVEAVAEEQAGKVKVVSVNVDEEPALSQAYGVRGIPMTGFFQDGKMVHTLVGAHPKRTLEKAIKKTFK